MARRRWEHISLTLPILLFAASMAIPHNSLALASPVSVQRLGRPDPAHHLKSYHGGYNITNHHYWTSAIFTGIHGYAIAAIWMLLGLGIGSYAMLKNSSSLYGCCCNMKSDSNSNHVDNEHPNPTIYYIIFYLIVLFSILAIVASGFSVAMNIRSSQNTKKVTETIMGAGAEARASIKNVTQAMDQMQTYLASYNPSITNLLNVTTHWLGKESRTIRRFIRQSEPSIDKAIQITYTINLILILFNLIFIVAVFVPFFLHWYPGLIMVILMCWLFTAFSWVITGFDFFLHVFAEDTCSALQDFEKNSNGSSLTSLLPCANASYTNSVLSDIGSVAHGFIQSLNSKMANFTEFKDSYDKNAASSSALIICDPFSNPNYTFNMDICPKNAIQVGDVPNIISNFVCYNNNNESEECKKEGKFVSKAMYLMVSAYSYAIQDLIDMFPDFENLLRCAFVKDTFSKVIFQDCRPYKTSTKRLWGSMLSFSIIMVILVLLWITRAYQENGKSFTYCSITPNNILTAS